MSCNIYRDLGYSDSDDMLVKCDLAINMEELLRRHSVTTDHAAHTIGASPQHVEQVLRGHFREDPVELLQAWLTALRAHFEPVATQQKLQPGNPGEFQKIPPLIIS